MEAEIGVMQSHAKACLEPLEFGMANEWSCP